MNKFIKFSAKEEYKTPLCEVLDVEAGVFASSLGNPGMPGANGSLTYDPNEGLDF